MLMVSWRCVLWIISFYEGDDKHTWMHMYESYILKNVDDLCRCVLWIISFYEVDDIYRWTYKEVTFYKMLMVSLYYTYWK